MSLCDHCSKEIPQPVVKPGCPQCVRAHEFSKECRECIAKGGKLDAFPKFKPRVEE